MRYIAGGVFVVMQLFDVDARVNIGTFDVEVLAVALEAFVVAGVNFVVVFAFPR